MIPISKPLIDEEALKAVEAVLRSGNIAQGQKVREFENAFADYIGVDHAAAVNSGTAALHTALLANDIGPGDEVITTPFTFAASANSILFTGAKPVFADIEEDTFNIDAEKIDEAITPKTRAIMPVHLYGQPCDMKAIGELCEDHGLALIEDACQAHGAEFGGKKVGSFGTGCFSFYATKNMTTGEGGMITTNDIEVARKARLLINHGSSVRYYHETLGYNYRMTDIAASIGIHQLKKLDYRNDIRIRNAKFFTTALKNLPGLKTPTAKNDRKHVFHQYTIRLTPDFPASRRDFIKVLESNQIGYGVYYPLPVHRQKIYAGLKTGDMPAADAAAEQVISLPVHPGVTSEEMEKIISTVVGLNDR